MQIALWVSPAYQNDRAFSKTGPININNVCLPFRSIRDAFKQQDLEVHTQDYYLGRNVCPSVVLFFEIPEKPIEIVLGAWFSKVVPFVLLCECEVVIQKNWDYAAHDQFKKIFTWHDSLIGKAGGRYVWMKDSPCLNEPRPKDRINKKKLCVLVNANKNSNHPLELYSKRLEAIRWFEKNAAHDFEFYGVGWDKYKFKRFPLRVLNRLQPLSKLLARKFRCYQGMAPNNIETISNYRFCICYENARDITGYITEKIFNCFTAGTVPIYWGASNVTDHIPASCFIDKRDFLNYEDLYRYIGSMSEEEYLGYQDAMTNFISSERSNKFRIDNFSNIIASNVIDSMVKAGH